MSILSITKQDGFLNLGYILKNKIKPTIAAFISLVRVGYSVFFEQVFMRIGFMMTAIMAAKQGTDAMAAHQVGHAIQYAENYTPIKIRMAILPVAQFGSSAWILFFILGIVFNMPLLRGVGIGLFAAIVLFQLITLPVEFNASYRALATIKNQGILFGAEYTGAKKTLTAAAMTYVASLAVALLQLLRLIASSRRD